MNKTTAAATRRPLYDLSPAAILDAHRAAARAVVADCPIPSPAECDAQTAALIAQESTAARVCDYAGHAEDCAVYDVPLSKRAAILAMPANVDAAAVHMAATLDTLLSECLCELAITRDTKQAWTNANAALDAYRAAAALPARVPASIYCCATHKQFGGNCK